MSVSRSPGELQGKVSLQWNGKRTVRRKVLRCFLSSALELQSCCGVPVTEGEQAERGRRGRPFKVVFVTEE